MLVKSSLYNTEFIESMMRKILFAVAWHYSSPVRLGSHHFAQQFKKNEWDVYYFSNPLSPFNICFSRDRTSIAERLNIYKQGGVTTDGIWEYVPLTLVPHHNNVPLLNRRIFLDNYYKFMLPSIRSILRKQQIHDVDILWMEFSNQPFWTRAIRYKKLIYRIPDNIVAFSKTSKATIASHYEIMEKADLILMTSKLLINSPEHDAYRHKIIYCPNGVDLSHFNRESYPVPEEYETLKNKDIALYIGSIDEWFDFDLLKDLGSQCRDTNFVIIGPQKVKIPSGIGGNIIFLGPKQYQTIPLFIHHSKFGIIPFRNNELVKYVNPIKMYEFLSLGKPVISTCWDELKELNAPIGIARNHAEFISLVKDVQGRNNHYKREELINYARNNTWESCYDIVRDKLETLTR